MNIFLRELKANRRALIIWSISMFLLVASGMAKYTGYSAGGVGSDIFKDLPASIKALLGFGNLDIGTMSGFYAVIFLYIELVASIHAVLLGSGIIAKEERDKTTEFLMTKPVSRTTIITSKFGAAFVNIVILNIVSLVSSIIMVSAYNKGDDISSQIVLFMVSMFFVQLIFLSFGAVLAAVTKNPKASGSLSVGILLVSFVISKLTDLTDRLDILNLLSPFKYFSYGNIASDKGLNLTVAAFSFLLAVGFATLTYFFYQKRDLNV